MRTIVQLKRINAMNSLHIHCAKNQNSKKAGQCNCSGILNSALCPRCSEGCSHVDWYKGLNDAHNDILEAISPSRLL